MGAHFFIIFLWNISNEDLIPVQIIVIGTLSVLYIS